MPENDFFFSLKAWGDNLPSPAYTFHRERKRTTEKASLFEHVISSKGLYRMRRGGTEGQGRDFIFLSRLYSHKYWSDKNDPYHKIWINAGGRLLDGVVNACGFTDGAVVVPARTHCTTLRSCMRRWRMSMIRISVRCC